jgi:Rieske Fe-S protein
VSIPRRGVLRLFTVVFGGLFGGLCGGSGLATLFSKRGDDGWQAVGKLAELPDGTASRVRFTVKAGWESTERPVYLMRRGQEITAFDGRCTHLGCTVRFRAGDPAAGDPAAGETAAGETAAGEFRCPCHGGVFDADGQPQSGPVSEPLRRLETRVVNGTIEARG